MPKLTRTRLAYHRRLYVAYLIDSGINTVPSICEESSLSRRNVEDIIQNMSDYDIILSREGSRRSGYYSVECWGFTDRDEVQRKIIQIQHLINQS
ncbi:helix-turn-helix domain-containing protein [Vibrio harveyi]|uniref:helix-turn-helix domain-containing protein n=1 Tax=Vibrio harveyi TaxID=669 RepID=UPI003CCBEE63